MLCGCSVVYDKSIPLEEMYSVNMQSSLCRSSPPKVAIIYTIVILQFCGWSTMCDRVHTHNEVEFRRNNITKLGF